MIFFQRDSDSSKEASEELTDVTDLLKNFEDFFFRSSELSKNPIFVVARDFTYKTYTSDFAEPQGRGSQGST